MIRKRPLILPLLTALFVFAAIGSSQVGTTTQVRKVFGPESFTRTTGAPNVYTRSFTVPTEVIGPYTLHIENGQPDGRNRISSGTVSINGVEIVHPSDFNQTVAAIDRSISLSLSNTLTVTLNSKPNSFIMAATLSRHLPSTLAAPSSRRPSSTAPSFRSVCRPRLLRRPGSFKSPSLIPLPEVGPPTP